MIKMNKNITITIFAHTILFSYTQAMELKLKDMAPEVKELILKAEQKRVDALKYCKEDSYESCKRADEALSQYRKKVADIASNPNNLMSKKNRLQYLLGDNYFEKRKTIIKSMIEDDGIDPNEIYPEIYALYHNPFNDSISRNDLDFTNYLFAHGARPHYKDLCIGGTSLMYERVCKNDMLRNLFLKYRVMFYRKEKYNIMFFKEELKNIMPDWEKIPVQDLTQSLSNLINVFIKTKKGKTRFVMTVVHGDILTRTVNAIKDAGFEVIHSNSNVTLLTKNILGIHNYDKNK